MHFPELIAIHAFRLLSGAPGKIVVWQRMVAEHITYLIVKSIATLRDDIIDGAATGAAVTALFGWRDRCIYRNEDVTAFLVDR